MTKQYLAGILLFTVFTIFVATQTIAATIQLPKTGQNTCYDAPGNGIPCQGSGQDGEKLAGVAWPNPRFTDNNNGTVSDNLTGLVWLKNANCTYAGATPQGYLTWSTGLAWASNIRDGVCGLTDSSVVGEWRLPNVVELESLVDLSSSGTYGVPAIPANHPFANVEWAVYLTSTTLAGSPNHGWLINMSDGQLVDHQWSKGSGNGYAWAVRDPK